jgi:hypothetical protein
MKKFIRNMEILSLVPLGVGGYITWVGYRFSRPDYYLTQPGSAEDDYTVGGYLIVAFGLAVIVFGVVRILRSKK